MSFKADFSPNREWKPLTLDELERKPGLHHTSHTSEKKARIQEKKAQHLEKTIRKNKSKQLQREKKKQFKAAVMKGPSAGDYTLCTKCHENFVRISAQKTDWDKKNICSLCHRKMRTLVIN
ncbi:MAG: hypothetical protein H7A37_09330 [Chlamydiales bacterium]|nr:hypothetical protein [Chlamydiia bacterium]MCP5508478.1 hypothetical protein [Chlamydiales bacterium]